MNPSYAWKAKLGRTYSFRFQSGKITVCNVSIIPLQMENSRKSYESATQQLVSFLEHVTTMLQATSPSQRKLFEATKAQVN